jgi:hypothetical protein
MCWRGAPQQLGNFHMSLPPCLQGDTMQQRLSSYFAFQIREDTSAIYGDGFRIAYEAFQRGGGGMRGLTGVVNNVLRLGRFPT